MTKRLPTQIKFENFDMTKWLRWIISDESQNDPLCSLTTASFRSSGGERRKAEQQERESRRRSFRPQFPTDRPAERKSHRSNTGVPAALPKKYYLYYRRILRKYYSTVPSFMIRKLFGNLEWGILTVANTDQWQSQLRPTSVDSKVNLGFCRLPWKLSTYPHIKFGDGFGLWMVFSWQWVWESQVQTRLLICRC